MTTDKVIRTFDELEEVVGKPAVDSLKWGPDCDKIAKAMAEGILVLRVEPREPEPVIDLPKMAPKEPSAVAKNAGGNAAEGWKYRRRKR